jgi:hypothetical protein
MNLTPLCGNFKDEHGNTKPTTVKIYHKHKKYVYKRDGNLRFNEFPCFQMDGKLLLHLLGLTILNNWILSPICETNLSQKMPLMFGEESCR